MSLVEREREREGERQASLLGDGERKVPKTAQVAETGDKENQQVINNREGARTRRNNKTKIRAGRFELGGIESCMPFLSGRS